MLDKGLYIVATPIGNLQDISDRALNVLKNVDYILAEDTRNTKKLLDFFKIKKNMQSYHQHNETSVSERIIKDLNEKIIALVSDIFTFTVRRKYSKATGYTLFASMI